MLMIPIDVFSGRTLEPPAFSLFAKKRRALYFLGIVTALLRPLHPAPLSHWLLACGDTAALTSLAWNWYSKRYVWLALYADRCSILRS